MYMQVKQQLCTYYKYTTISALDLKGLHISSNRGVVTGITGHTVPVVQVPHQRWNWIQTSTVAAQFDLW